MLSHYDIIIIGAGPGGYETAAGAAARGHKVLLVEREALGGTCLNHGCIPTKCLCSAAEKIVELNHAADFGVKAELAGADYAFAVRRAAGVMDELRGGIAELLAGVDIVEGEARIDAGPAVCVGDERFTADKIIIATGSRPAALRCEGADEAINSDAFLKLETLPERLTIVGGGVIGLEFASIAAAYGTKVTVLEYCPEILPNFDADIAKRLNRFLGRRGIDIVCGAEVTKITADKTVTYLRKGKEKSVEGDMVLCAVGRRPVVPEGCELVGIELDKRGFIVTDEAMQTSVAGVYAIGDVNGRCLLAHAASAQGKIVLGEKTRLDIMPSVVFTLPECASVSLRCENVKSVKLPYGANGKALASGQSDGLLKLDYDAETGVITGCHAVGAHAADLVAVATIAISKSMTMHELAEETIFAHPTLSELIAQCALAFDARFKV